VNPGRPSPVLRFIHDLTPRAGETLSPPGPS
jgi:hypothetical protein